MKKIFNFILIAILIIGITGCTNKKTEQVATYLEEMGYTCEENDDMYSCTLEKGVKKHTFVINDIGSRRARELVYYYDDNVNTYEIRTQIFTHGDWIILKDDIDNEKCLYYVENRIETVKHYEEFCKDSDIECQNKQSYCRDYLPQVRESVSLFLKIYKENDIELKIIESK